MLEPYTYLHRFTLANTKKMFFCSFKNIKKQKKTKNTTQMLFRTWLKYMASISHSCFLAFGQDILCILLLLLLLFSTVILKYYAKNNKSQKQCKKSIARLKEHLNVFHFQTSSTLSFTIIWRLKYVWYWIKKIK